MLQGSVTGQFWQRSVTGKYYRAVFGNLVRNTEKSYRAVFGVLQEYVKGQSAKVENATKSS